MIMFYVPSSRPQRGRQVRLPAPLARLVGRDTGLGYWPTRDDGDELSETERRFLAEERARDERLHRFLLRAAAPLSAVLALGPALWIGEGLYAVTPDSLLWELVVVVVASVVAFAVALRVVTLIRAAVRARYQQCPICHRDGVVEDGLMDLGPIGLGLPSEARACLSCWDKAGRMDRRWSVRACRRARTLDDLAALTAQWLAGRMAVGPSYDGPPDPETRELVPTLMRLNRAGILTIQSQPGYDGPACNGGRVQQRAALAVYCPAALAPRLRQAMANAGVEVHTEGAPFPDTIRGTHDPLSRWERWLSERARMPRPGLWYPGGAQADLDRAVFMLLVDPEWGRVESPLWEAADDFVAGLAIR